MVEDRARVFQSWPVVHSIKTGWEYRLTLVYGHLYLPKCNQSECYTLCQVMSVNMTVANWDLGTITATDSKCKAQIVNHIQESAIYNKWVQQKRNRERASWYNSLVSMIGLITVWRSIVYKKLSTCVLIKVDKLFFSVIYSNYCFLLSLYSSQYVAEFTWIS